MDYNFKHKHPVVLLISIFFPPERSGGATGAYNRAMVLQKLGYSVYVISGFPSYPTGKVTDTKYRGKFFFIERIESTVVIRFRLFPIAHSGYLRRLILFLNFLIVATIYLPKIINMVGKENIKITYARSPVIFSAFLGLVYSKMTKSFLIYEAPDLWPEELVAFKTKLSPIIFLVGKLAAKLSFNIPDMIITISELAALHITKYYRPKVSVYGIPVGVDPTKFPSLPKYDCRAKLIDDKVVPSVLKDKFIILYSGIISGAQGIESLVCAAYDVRKYDKDVVFLIIGEGPDKQKLHRLTGELKLDNFYILPSQPREMMPVIISAADVCAVLLSPEPIFNIALPTKFYEYLACCKPLIVVSQGELGDIVTSNGIGYTIKVGDTEKLVSIIRKLKCSQPLMQKLQENCQKTLEKFSLESIASRFLDILERETKK